MRLAYNWLSICMMLFVSSSFTKCKSTRGSEDRLFNVTIYVTRTDSYCGGARPTDEILNAITSPKPLADKEIFIRPGSVNNTEDKILGQGVSDKNGIVVLNLPKGNYHLVFSNKSDRSFSEELLKTYEEKSQNYSAINKACLEEWLKQPELLFEVKAKDAVFTVNWNQPCPWHAVPCVNYTGPLPP